MTRESLEFWSSIEHRPCDDERESKVLGESDDCSGLPGAAGVVSKLVFDFWMNHMNEKCRRVECTTGLKTHDGRLYEKNVGAV